MVYEKLGGCRKRIAAAVIYPAMEKGSLVAVEWVGPYDDERLGFAKVAKYYYGPGVMELGANLAFNVNQESWDSLPPSYQAALRAGCAMAANDLLAKYDANNIRALKKLVGEGTQLMSWPREVMDA